VVDTQRSVLRGWGQGTRRELKRDARVLASHPVPIPLLPRAKARGTTAASDVLVVRGICFRVIVILVVVIEDS
jgi:hypothetical protein